ncbi:superoxide dismutase [Cu-Zn] isoform X2 [Folsomia candida]|uniref:superoxide dismutase [Cu-Zn] isoform X2 n=1 Tax=Folsomia candida TaxID=158441 RepID=UPI000B8FFB45|nr:superoxide dismutase [Cu-Zn] isoform X2 [Folsomia candida]
MIPKILVVGILLIHQSQGQPPQQITKAVACFNIGNEKSGVNGVLEIYQDPSGSAVYITGQISGLQPNTVHGFHVHQFGDVRQGCDSLGGHFNPWNQSHGGPWDYARHVGDLGNIKADATGQATVNIWDSLISLNGVNSIVGRGFAIHEKEDDLGRGSNPESRMNGNSGPRIACGIIGVL